MDTHFNAPNWNVADLPKFQKCFYTPNQRNLARSDSEVNAYLAQHDITVSGRDTPRPVLSFDEVGLPDGVSRVIQKNGWKQPTPIQAQAWPLALTGRDVVGIARTGSGKTASFIVPAIIHIAAQSRVSRGDGPVCLVLVPTRELAQQVLTVSTEFAYASGMRSMCFYGGSPRGPQLRDLNRGAEICIATPGRLIDFMKSER